MLFTNSRNFAPQSRFSSRLLRLYLLVLIALSLWGLAGCYVPFHRLRDLEPEFHIVGDWRASAEIRPILRSKNVYVEVISWYGGADTTRIPFQDEILVVDDFVVEYEAEGIALKAGLERYKLSYDYNLTESTWNEVDFHPGRGNLLLAVVNQFSKAGLHHSTASSFSDDFLTEVPLFSCQPIKTLLLGAKKVRSTNYRVGSLDLDSLRVESWNLPAPRSFGSTWQSEEIREPKKNGPIRVSFRVRIYDLSTCELILEKRITELQERHTEWDWFMGK